MKKVILFPAPYATKEAAPGKQKQVDVLYEAWADIQMEDLSEADTNLVASLDRDFPKGAFRQSYSEGGDGDKPYRRPGTEVREWNGRFFAPLYSVDPSAVSVAPEPFRVTHFNLVDAFATGRKNVCAFKYLEGLPLNTSDGFEWVSTEQNAQIKKQLDGNLPRLEGEGDERYEKTLQTITKGLESELILIDGKVWVHIEEPTIVAFVREPNRSVKLGVSLFSTFDNTFSSDCHIFPLDRLDDCLSLIDETYPGFEIDRQFSDLKVVDQSSLKYSGDAEELVSAAKTTYRLARKMMTTMSREMAVAFYDLRDTLETTEVLPVKNQAEKVYAVLKHFAEAPSSPMSDYRVTQETIFALRRWENRKTLEFSNTGFTR